jgi:hypothetical protein
VWDRQEEREAFWAELRRTGSIRERECRFRNRTGKAVHHAGELGRNPAQRCASYACHGG